MCALQLTSAEADGWPVIDRGWLYEAWKRSSQRALTFHEAMDQVASRYLKLGDARPLLDGVLRLNWQPGTEVLSLLSNLILVASSSDLVSKGAEYRLGFKLHRSPGRPAVRLSQDRQAERDQLVKYLDSIRIAAVTMSRGQMPPRNFWLWLAAQLEPSCVPPAISVPNIPIQAAFVLVSAKRGRRVDPELDARDEVLGRKVRQRLGTSVKRAVGDVYEEIQQIARAEGWTGELNEETVRKAFVQSRASGRIKP